MTKRQVESGLEELRPQLADLRHAERLQLALEAAAADEPAQLERLFETCPTRSSPRLDPAFERCFRQTTVEAMQALYDLQRVWLRFRGVHQRWCQQRLWVLLTDAEPPEPVPLQVSEETVADCYADCAIYYRAYDRLATDVLGVDLETWLGAFHPHGPPLVRTLSEDLEAYPGFRERAEAALREATDDETAPRSIDDLADKVYAERAAT
ncbi:hypothetical protein [Halosolutus halophilus]|uniref:hypothetical protein n=1 Tax=Halosolutus halophilus TaxID=1552990 RepID=UPI0022350DC7|nr:hypothetical protein [Halosolutus halophilus]